MNDDERPGRGATAPEHPPRPGRARDPDGHRSIRRHADALAAMFRNYLGYRLVVEAQFARLYKAGLSSAGRPLRRRSKAVFSPRDYTYLALLCAVLLTSRQQVLLSTVVADVRHAAAEAEIGLGDDTLTERRALVHALGQLIEWGAVHEDPERSRSSRTIPPKRPFCGSSTRLCATSGRSRCATSNPPNS